MSTIARNGGREGFRPLPALLPAIHMLACLLACLLTLLAGPAAWAGPTGPTLTIGVGRDLYDGPESRAYVHGSTHAWEALTYVGPGLKAQPWLAESWRAGDGGRTWVFRLRAGVRFHDGSPLTAADVKASVERIASRPRFDPAGVYRDLAAIETRGEREVVFRLRRPCPDFANLVAYFSSPVIKPTCFGEGGRLSGLVATGPFRLKAVRPGQSLTLEAFPDYWGPRPAYAAVVFRTILDAQTRAMALMAGEVDAVADVGAILPQQAEEIRAAPGLVLQRVEVATTHYLLFNCRRPPFDAVSARHWLAGLTDRQEMIRVLARGAGRLARDPFTPLAGQWAFGLLRPGPGSRPASPGRPLVILLHGATLERWPYRDMAQLIQERLRAQGLPARVAVREPGAYYEDLRLGRFDLALQPNTLMTGEPDFFYAYYVVTGGPRDCGCGSPEMDRLIQKGRSAMDPAERRAVYQELAGLFSRRLPLLPLYHDVSLYAHGPSVARFEMDHNFRPLLLEARPQVRPQVRP